VRKHCGGFRGGGEIEVGRVGRCRAVGHFASDWLCHEEIGILLPVLMRGAGGRRVLVGRAGACICGALLQPGGGARQRWLLRGEASIGLVPERLVQRGAAHHAAAKARADDEDVGGSEEPGGRAVAGCRDMGAERPGAMPAMLDESEDEGDKDGEGVRGCGGAGPSPRWIGLGSASGCGGCGCVHGVGLWHGSGGVVNMTNEKKFVTNGWWRAAACRAAWDAALSRAIPGLHRYGPRARLEGIM